MYENFNVYFKGETNPNNMNRENGFSLSRSWNPLISSLEERKKIISKDQRVTSS
jgi:hypothetical protein